MDTKFNYSKSVTFDIDGEEMLRLSTDGFFVRGVKLNIDDTEALAVYNSFSQWLAWAQLQRNDHG